MDEDRRAALRSRLIRNIDEVERVRETRDPLYDTLTARLATGTAASKLGISVDTLAPGRRGCPYHLHHAQEEAFVILRGHGSLRVAGELLPLRAGDVVFIPAGPEYPHQIVNTSDAPLEYLSISTMDSPEICEYPDSRKVYATARHAGGRFAHLHRTGDDLDYWDAEP
ncbi:MAG TPA: cupin domain-containing protein [Burkholderiales bacterium]|nr:cupin domain-containing protein [Burkholderiales bacterium]